MKKVILASNNGYVEHLMVTIKSILLHTSAPQNLEIIIIDGGISDVNRRLILKKMGRENIRFIKINTKKYSNLKKIGHLGEATYYRLEIPKIFKSDKIVYIDCDTVVLGDILELFEIDLGGRTIGAVKDYNLDLVNHEDYFNAGLMIIDCQKWNKKKYTDKFFEWCHQNQSMIRIADQCILNGILKYDWKSLPLEWNRQRILLEFTPGRMGLSKKSYIFLRENPKMIHYTGKMKPWHKRYTFPDKREYLTILKELKLYRKKKYTVSDAVYIAARKIVNFLKLRYFLESRGLAFYANSD